MANKYCVAPQFCLELVLQLGFLTFEDSSYKSTHFGETSISSTYLKSMIRHND